MLESMGLIMTLELSKDVLLVKLVLAWPCSNLVGNLRLYEHV